MERRINCRGNTSGTGRSIKEMNNKIIKNVGCNVNNNKVSMKNSSPWDFLSDCNGSSKTTTTDQEADLHGLFSWPPRSYSCSFCKREFRSAQALGGHMNVHRRDRARLRQSPPRDQNNPHFSLLNLNLDPNPNFNTNPSHNISSLKYPPPPPSHLIASSTNLPSPFPPATVSTISTTPPSTVSGVHVHQMSQYSCPENRDLVMKSKAAKRVLELHENKDQDSVLMKRAGDNIVRLELEIGFFGEAKEADLDLELRLGYST